MKKILLFLFVAFAALSCQEKIGGDGSGTSTSKYVDYSGGKVNLILTKDKTVEADGDGVSIAIKSVTNSNVIFECRPGANVQSYRVDVIPLAMIYNTIVNEKLASASKEEIEDMIIQLLEVSSSVNGVVFTEENLEDFYSHTFDWMSTEYHNGNILCDCDYVICVVPCFDTEGKEPSAPNLCWFQTPSLPLVGDPDVRIDVNSDHRAFQAIHEPNDDCKYICYWSIVTDQIDEYWDLFGDRMMRDFIRCASETYDVANVADMSYKVDFKQSADATVYQTCLAVALDVNGTPSKYIARRDFTLEPIPEGVAEAEYTIVPSRVAASAFWLDINFGPACMNCYYRWLKVEQADVIKAYSDEQKEAYAKGLLEGGWGVSNPEYHFDKENNVATGDNVTVTDYQIVAYKPQPQYVIVSAGENFYGEPTELQFSEPIVMKTRVIDNPASCLISDDEFTCFLDEQTRTGFRYNFEYDNPQDIALIYFQIVSPVDSTIRKEHPETCPPEDLENASHADWMKFFFETYHEAADGEKVLQVNTWAASKSGNDSMAMYGYEPGVEYVVAYCVEDFNGVISNVRMTKITTTDVTPGDNPQASVSAQLTDGEWVFTFSANDDTGTMLYMTSSYGDANYETLGLPFLLNDPYDDFPEYSNFFDTWDEKIMSLGLSTKSLKTYASEAPRTDGSVILALCLPIGKDSDGREVYGELQHLIIHDNQVKHLEDFRTKE